MQDEVKIIPPYKIMEGDIITVHRKDWNGYTFYSANFNKKLANGKTITGSKTLKFRNEVDLDDKTKIRVLKMFEDFYLKEYTTIWTVFILDFEVIKNEQQAIEDYQKELLSDDMPF